MKRFRVSDAVKQNCREPIIVRGEASIYETVQLLIDAPHARSAFVVDEQGRLVGIVTLKDLVQHIFTHLYFEKKKAGRSILELIHKENAIDLAKIDPVCVTKRDNLEDAVRKVLDNDMEEIPVVDEEGNVIGDLNLLELLSIWFEDNLQREARSGYPNVRLSRYIDEKLFCPDLKSTDKDGALEEMFELLGKVPQVKNLEELKQVIRRREILVTTGVGKGIAIPHGRCGCLHDCILVVGLSQKGIDFTSMDGKPVHIIVMIVAPESSNCPYAVVLAQIMQLLRCEVIKQKILTCRTPEQLKVILEEFDRACEAQVPVGQNNG